MKTAKSRSGSWLQFWKRNGVVAAIILFVGAAVYLNWNYEQQEAGKVLGEPTLVNGEEQDPLVTGTPGSITEVTGNEGEEVLGDAQGETASSAYFANARLNREQARDSALGLLQDAAAGEDADQSMKDQANETIQTMADYTVTEAQIENLVVAKGYADCVAFIGDDSVSVAVAAPEEGFTDADTARILEIVTDVSAFSPEQIKIIPVM